MNEDAVARMEGLALGQAAMPAHRLDALSLDDLRLEVSRTIKHEGCFSEPFAERLDGVLTVKLVRTLRSGRTTVRDLRALDELIASIARDRYEAQLNNYPKSYYTRWKALRDTLSAAQRLQVHESELRDASTTKREPAWEFVLDALRKAGNDGIAWSELAERIQGSEFGPTSRGGISTMLRLMTAERLIEMVPRGKYKQVFLGQAAQGAVAQVSDKATKSPVVNEIIERDKSRHFADLARQVVCFNQGAYTDFSFLAHEYHRELKECLTEIQRLGQNRNIERIETKAKELLQFVDRRFKSAALENFKLFSEHFRGRSEIEPRICIKGNIPIRTGAKDEIVSIIRSDGSVKDTNRYPLDENTGFAEVVRTGYYYLNDDIASSAILGHYRNPRLDQSRLNELGSLELGLVDSGRGFSLDQWRRCWNDWSHEADQGRFYRSTLIIPLTLRNNNLSSDFRTRLSRRESSIDFATFDRTILGFLCLDHPKAQFFNKYEDVSLGYIVADQLSLYTFTSLILTRLSSVFRCTIGFDHKEARRLVNALQAYAQAISQDPPSLQATPEQSLTIRQTVRNQLISTALFSFEDEA